MQLVENNLKDFEETTFKIEFTGKELCSMAAIFGQIIGSSDFRETTDEFYYLVENLNVDVLMKYVERAEVDVNKELLKFFN